MTTIVPRLYAQRDAMALDQAGNFYAAHVQAMTEEGLYSKSAIAAELAVRDAILRAVWNKVELIHVHLLRAQMSGEVEYRLNAVDDVVKIIDELKAEGHNFTLGPLEDET